MKTAREWFETFPEPYRSQAIENIDPLLDAKVYESASLALDDAFFWHDTDQGFDYWEVFFDSLIDKNQ